MESWYLDLFMFFFFFLVLNLFVLCFLEYIEIMF